MLPEHYKTLAKVAYSYIPRQGILGVGTGRTVNAFIEGLLEYRDEFSAVVASSLATARALKGRGYEVVSPNEVSHIDVYIDGADEVSTHRVLIKGGGGALTGEKILASMAKRFICIASAEKHVEVLGKFPLAVEVLDFARSYVARQFVKLGGEPVYREGFLSDYGNPILDVHHLEILDPMAMEIALNQWPGVVTHGIFASRRADLVILGNEKGEIWEFNEEPLALE